MPECAGNKGRYRFLNQQARGLRQRSANDGGKRPRGSLAGKEQPARTGYISGVTGVVRLGGGLLARAGASLAARRAAATGVEEVAGLFGKVSVDALEAAASSSGPTVQIVTKLTQFPQAGRALSVATGEGAEALANAARSTGQLYRANVPQALLQQLERSGLAVRSTTQMAESNATATEYRFLPQATRFITFFFKE